MHFLTLLPLASLVLAAPAAQSKRSTCTTQQWNIQQFEAFTAGSTSTNGSHLSFYFTDPKFDSNKILCSRSMQLGASSQTGPNSLSDSNWYPCESTELSVMYRYEGSSMDLQRTGVNCGNVTYTAEGSTGLSLQCYTLFGGTQCETVTQVNINPSQLTVTKIN